MEPLTSEVRETVAAAATRGGLVVALTGAGISAESGIPTFRGPEGWWTVGSVRYTPQEIATRATFGHAPEAVWAWYLHRLAAVRDAAPNAAHHALVDLERALGDRFVLVTQNVDGLHRRAGSTRMYEIHGSLEFVRCADACTSELRPRPELLGDGPPAEGLTDAQRSALTCPSCGGWLRPHVLWFDEVYDEEHFRFDSTVAAAERATLLLIIGTSGATTLPALMARAAAGAGATLVDINPEDNPFGDAARETGGAVVRSPASAALPGLVAAIAGGGQPLDPGASG